MDNEQRDKKWALLNNQVQFLKSNGFDTVQIFVSLYDDAPMNEEKNITYWSVGEGNYLARYGHLKAWIIHEEASMPDTFGSEE